MLAAQALTSLADNDFRHMRIAVTAFSPNDGGTTGCSILLSASNKFRISPCLSFHCLLFLECVFEGIVEGSPARSDRRARTIWEAKASFNRMERDGMSSYRQLAQMDIKRINVVTSEISSRSSVIVNNSDGDSAGKFPLVSRVTVSPATLMRV